MDKDLHISTKTDYSNFSKYRIKKKKNKHIPPQSLITNEWKQHGKNFISNISHARRTKENVYLQS